MTDGVIGLIWLGSGTFIVKEGHTGVVTTFGRLSHTTGAGFNWRWPYPFQAHDIVNVSQVRTAEIGYRNSVRNKQPRESLMLTDDENIVDALFAVQYRLKDAKDYVFNTRNPDDVLVQVATTAISAGAHSLERVVTTPAMMGSIAALAKWKSVTQAVKISSGRHRSSTLKPEGRSGS